MNHTVLQSSDPVSGMICCQCCVHHTAHMHSLIAMKVYYFVWPAEHDLGLFDCFGHKTTSCHHSLSEWLSGLECDTVPAG